MLYKNGVSEKISLSFCYSLSAVHFEHRLVQHDRLAFSNLTAAVKNPFINLRPPQPCYSFTFTSDAIIYLNGWVLEKLHELQHLWGRFSFLTNTSRSKFWDFKYRQGGRGGRFYPVSIFVRQNWEFLSSYQLHWFKLPYHINMLSRTFCFLPHFNDCSSMNSELLKLPDWWLESGCAISKPQVLGA